MLYDTKDSFRRKNATTRRPQRVQKTGVNFWLGRLVACPLAFTGFPRILFFLGIQSATKEMSVSKN